MSYTSYTPQTNSPCLSKAPFYLHRYTSLESWGNISPAKLLGLPPWSCHGQVTPCCPSQSHNDQGCSSYSANPQLHSKANFPELVCAMAISSDFCSTGCLGFLTVINSGVVEQWSWPWSSSLTGLQVHSWFLCFQTTALCTHMQVVK